MAELDPEEKEIEQKMVKITNEMPPSVQKRFKALKILSDERSKLNDVFEEELKTLQNKIIERKKPILEERKKIVAGEITEFGDRPEKFNKLFEELKKEKESLVAKNIDLKKDKKGDEDKDDKEDELVVADVDHLKEKVGIPDFWHKVIKNANMIMELVKDKDEEILKHITHAESEKTDKPKTLQVTLHFSPNDYFENSSLSLKAVYKGDTEEVERTEGTEIQWKEGKDVTKKKIKKKQKHKKTNETRTIVKTVEADSFFNLFTSRKAPDDENELEEEEEDTLMQKIDD